MKRTLFVLALIVGIFTLPALAQAATRPIVLTWTASQSSSVTGYSLYYCSNSTGTACIPVTTGTPAQTFTATATSAVFQGTIGSFYTFVLIANAPACTGTSAIGTPCGNSSPVSFTPNALPVPPTTVGASGTAVGVP